jgi:hypothetical protein
MAKLILVGPGTCGKDLQLWHANPMDPLPDFNFGICRSPETFILNVIS